MDTERRALEMARMMLAEGVLRGGVTPEVERQANALWDKMDALFYEVDDLYVIGLAILYAQSHWIDLVRTDET